MNIPERLLVLKERLQTLRKAYLQATIGERGKMEREARVIQNQIDVFERVIENRKKRA